MYSLGDENTVADAAPVDLPCRHHSLHYFHCLERHFREERGPDGMASRLFWRAAAEIFLHTYHYVFHPHI